MQGSAVDTILASLVQFSLRICIPWNNHSFFFLYQLISWSRDQVSLSFPQIPCTNAVLQSVIFIPGSSSITQTLLNSQLDSLFLCVCHSFHIALPAVHRNYNSTKDKAISEKYLFKEDCIIYFIKDQDYLELVQHLATPY